MDSNPESGCDFDNVDSCSSVSDEMRSNYTVYGDKLYYVVEAFNKKDQLTETIIRSNFDGTEEEQLLSVTKSDDGEDVSFALQYIRIFYIMQTATRYMLMTCLITRMKYALN